MEIKAIKEGCEAVAKTRGSNGYDLVNGEVQIVKAGERKLLKTGIVIVNAYPNEYLQLHLRSRMWKEGIELANGTGIIDGDYREEIMIPVVNKSEEEYFYDIGESIAQIICMQSLPVQGATILDEKRKGGFGSTDKKGE